MAAQTIAVARAVLGAYDFSGIDTLVDVGGGYGAPVASVLSALSFGEILRLIDALRPRSAPA